MNKFWKGVLIAGACCTVAGMALTAGIAASNHDELVGQLKEINGVRIGKYQIDKYDFFNGNVWNTATWSSVGEESITIDGKKYSSKDANGKFYDSFSEQTEVKELCFRLSCGKISVEEGSEFSVSANDIIDGTITSKCENGVWYVEDYFFTKADGNGIYTIKNYQPNITITLPKNHVYNEIEFSIAAGEVNTECLNTGRLALEIGAGEMKIDRLIAEKSARIKVGAGSLNVKEYEGKNLEVDNGVGSTSITGIISGKNSIASGIGEVKIVMTDRNLVDFSYDVSCGIGEVRIDERTFHGETERKTSESGDHFDVSCGIGKVEIDVR